MVEDWLAAHALTGAPMRFYSDHPSDAPMFELADEAVAANPTRALRALAVARGWSIVDWD
jgi:phosphoserine phosphatase